LAKIKEAVTYLEEMSWKVRNYLLFQDKDDSKTMVDDCVDVFE